LFQKPAGKPAGFLYLDKYLYRLIIESNSIINDVEEDEYAKPGRYREQQ